MKVSAKTTLDLGSPRPFVTSLIFGYLKISMPQDTIVLFRLKFIYEKLQAFEQCEIISNFSHAQFSTASSQATLCLRDVGTSRLRPGA